MANTDHLLSRATCLWDEVTLFGDDDYDDLPVNPGAVPLFDFPPVPPFPGEAPFTLEALIDDQEDILVGDLCSQSNISGFDEDLISSEVAHLMKGASSAFPDAPGRDHLWSALWWEVTDEPSTGSRTVSLPITSDGERVEPSPENIAKRERKDWLLAHRHLHGPIALDDLVLPDAFKITSSSFDKWLKSSGFTGFISDRKAQEAHDNWDLDPSDIHARRLDLAWKLHGQSGYDCDHLMKIEAKMERRRKVSPSLLQEM